MTKKTNTKKSKSKTKPTKKTTKKNVLNKPTKKTTKKNVLNKPIKKITEKKPKIIQQESLITQIITAPVQTPTMIDPGFSKSNWRNIFDICENAIRIHRFNHQIRNVDVDLRKALFDIERLARENGIIDDILFIIRSKQTLLDKIKLIKNYCLRKI